MVEKHSSFKKPYIIAETAYNHEGDINYLYKMIDEISDLKLNAIKFHLLLKIDSYMIKNHSLYKKVEKWIFTEKQWSKIIDYANKKGLDIVALCDDVESISYIIKNKKKIKAIEIHATSLNDHFTLNEASKFKGQIILGIGGSDLDEISYATSFLKKNKKRDILLMYGFQSYPTNYDEINLSKMIKIKDIFNLPVGYADHTGFDDPYNEFISAAAAMMGFPILEKHYTCNHGKKRIDYQAAVGKKQMRQIKKHMEIALTAYGNESLKMSKSEKKYGSIGQMKKAIVAKKDIKKKEKLSLDNLWFKRTKEKSNIEQRQFLTLIGHKAKKDIKKDEIIDFTKIEK